MKGECPSPREDCHQPEGPYSDEHHRAWPAAQYSGWLACKYRNLPENKEQICRCEHDEIHDTEEPPIRPPRRAMSRAIINAFNNGQTSLSRKQKEILGL